MRRMIGTMLVVFVVVGLARLLAQGTGVAKIATPTAGHPDHIYYNAKVVTVDDASFKPTIGSIDRHSPYGATRILATGTNAEVRALAGPTTRQIDLEGANGAPQLHPDPRASDRLGMDGTRGAQACLS